MEQDKKRNIILALILVAIISVSVIGTYAYFLTSAGRNEEQKLTVKTGNLSLVFEDNDEGLVDSIMLGESKTKELRIRNTGTESVTTNMIWSGLINTYIEESLSYKLEYKISEGDTWKAVTTTSHTNIPHSKSAKDYNLATDLTIPAGQTYYYKLTITFNDLQDVNQEADLTAYLSTKFKLGERVSEKVVEIENMLVAREDFKSTEKIWEHSENITSVVFENTINPKENAAYTYDLSAPNSRGVTAYLVPTEEDSTKYVAYIQANGKIIANPDSSYLFHEFTNLKSITGLENLDTSNVTNMQYIFSRCTSLTSLNVSGFDTSNVTNMGYMFWYCSSLVSLNVNNFNTSNVTNMIGLFGGCSSLTSLNVSNFNTSKVTQMMDMFQSLNITSLDLSNFDTSNVTNMVWMFYGCKNLKKLDLNNFNTSNVTSIHGMFSGCSSLTSLDLGNFDTSNVNNLVGMFADCSSLATLNISNFVTSNVTSMANMFKNCSNLTSLNLSNFNTSKVTNMSGMFNGCSKLTSLNISKFDISAVTEENKKEIFNSVPSNIKITVGNTTLRTWCINASDSPKLTTSNFTIG